MSKLHLPKFPHITKHVLILVGLIAVVAVVLLGAAVATHEKKVSDAQATHNAQVQAARDKQTQATIDGLKAQNAQLSASHAVLCTYVNGLIQAPKTRGLVTSPTAANCPTPKK